MNATLKVLEPSGLIDNINGSQLRQEVADLLEAGAETILIDLTHITFMDSSGLGAMAAILQRVRTKNAKLYLCALNGQLRIIMELTRMDKVFDIFPDRATFDMAIQN